MFAVVKTGGKQYKVTPNDVIRVEKLDVEVGDQVSLDHVLMFSKDDTLVLDSPSLSRISVKATVLDQIKDKKIIIFKKKRRQNYRRKMGHRQRLTVLKIDSVE